LAFVEALADAHLLKEGTHHVRRRDLDVWQGLAELHRPTDVAYHRGIEFLPTREMFYLHRCFLIDYIYLDLWHFINSVVQIVFVVFDYLFLHIFRFGLLDDLLNPSRGCEIVILPVFFLFFISSQPCDLWILSLCPANKKFGIFRLEKLGKDP
jgi:hypothetical protein